MKKQNDNQLDEKIIAAQNQSQQYNQADTEFAADEDVQNAVAKSQQFEAQNQQPTFEPNKPF
ncbi:hypothetical protein [Cytobacillus purgationiresistens]|uniref:Small, acid-soluble spore protein gamma-type n=1 Tax=Cytobacillus purgationiresistens TaxID=863449 RepID=A0ABU0AQN0_9BACI|nr:hypothetical protein [Cytobacillus purgationiresistens]MDQ0273184.1 hypothetical protein [Cytobacillus purgationiresistens]